MVKKIIWTPEAERMFENIVTYLEAHWTEKEKRNFINATHKTIQVISRQPELFRKLAKLNTHEALITKHNLLLYTIKKDSIDLVTFWDTRQNPKKKYKKQ
jgi:plasmid stabilization system protein ParE